LKSWYAVPLNAINHLILFTAAFSSIWLLLARLRLWRVNAFEAKDGIAVFLMVGVFATFLMISLSIGETRYGILIHCFAGPFAALGLVQWVSSSLGAKIWSAALCLIYVVFALRVSDWMWELKFPGLV
jgi:hypothetical protein